MAYQPTISLIIAVKNAKDHLHETLQQISAQRYPYLEVIVVDGASEDGTLEVIQANKTIITHWVSEKDQGISDAFNKGMRLAKGDYLYFQGAGDLFYSANCIQALFHDLDQSFILVCGQVMRVKEDGITPVWVAPKVNKSFSVSSLLFKMSLPHQGLFTHRSFFEKWGKFDTNVRFAMDYELLLRAYQQFPKTILKKVLVARWRAGGIGTHRIAEIFDEYYRIKTQHRIASHFTLWSIDKITRLKYWLKMKLRLPY